MDTHDSELTEKLARIIAEAVGYEFDTLYQSKAEWIKDRGSRHDLNTPRKPDFIDAAEAVQQFYRHLGNT